MAVDHSDSPLEKFVARATQLYTLPAVAMEVLQLTNCPKVDTTALKDCIQRDPALVGKILRTVNSSLYGGVRNVSDLNQAITLLGIKPLKLLVLGFSLPPKLLSGIEQQSLAEYWKRTLIKAIAARDLAARYDNVDADDAFLVGLLQDIGMLALLKELGQPYVAFLEQARAGQADLVMLELQTLGFDHRLLSARMLQCWGLPESLWRPIAASTTADANDRCRSPLQAAANMLATAQGVALLLTHHQPAALAEVMHREGESDVAWWTQFAGRIQEQVEQIEGIFDVSVVDEQFDEIIQTAYREISHEAEGAAAMLGRRRSGRPSHADGAVLERAVADFTAEAMQSYESMGDDLALNSSLASASKNTSTALARDSDDLTEQIAVSVTACRRHRQPLSLVLFTVDEFDELVFQLGAGVVASLTENLRSRVAEHLEPGQRALVGGEAQLALLLDGAERLHAVAAARRILDEARSGNLVSQAGRRHPITASIGIASVALPAKNFPAAELHEAAERCLYAVQSSGGDSVKSIDIY